MSAKTQDILEFSPENDRLLERVFQEAVRRALIEHKRAGNPVVTWRDGKPVWIAPEDIPVDLPRTEDSD
jgi:hypothetical protein